MCWGTLIPLHHVFTLLITSEHQLWRAWILETPFGLLLWFIYNYISRRYNLFLQCVMTLWPCVSEWAWFLCSGPSLFLDLVFSDLCWSLLGSAAFFCLLICLLCSVHLSAAPEVGCWRPGEKTPCRRVSFPVLALLRISTIRLLRNSYPLSSNAHIRGNVYFESYCIGNTISVTILFLPLIIFWLMDNFWKKKIYMYMFGRYTSVFWRYLLPPSLGYKMEAAGLTWFCSGQL
jgi:hypothetical protein